MAVNFDNLDQQLTNTAAFLFRAPGTPVQQQIVILKASVVNTDTISHSVTFNRVPFAGAPATANELVQGMTISAGATAILPIAGQSLTGQQELWGKADTGAVVNFSASWAFIT